MSENGKLSYYSLEPHLFQLRLGGYYEIDPGSPILHKILHTIYMRVALILIIIYTIQQAMHVHEVRQDIDKVMGTVFLFLTHTDSIFKQIVLWIRADKFEELLDTMKGPLFNQGLPEHRVYLLRTARHAKLLVRANNGLALITCFLWVLYPLILHLQGKHVEFAIWLPFDVDVNPQFYLAAIYVWIMTSWLAICNTTIDVMVAFLLAQCQTQLFILRDDLEKLVQRSKEEAIYSKKSYEDIVHRRYTRIMLHHVEIVQFAKKVQNIFGGAVAYQFLASGWIICTSVYRMVQIDPLSVQFLSMIMYVICMLMELYMYCYYGSQVTHESLMLTQSAYAMNWLETSLKHRRDLIIFMEIIKHPIEPLAGNVIPLSNSTFVSIVKNSYSFYALLKNTNL
ncbi:odorant receptor 94a-like [Epargyreus clarus]|uniref:odorant receptor 94a-like n=1 Tax=Epargyreus clarus TaxID=520877 RepID=UPI003C2BF4DB